MATPLTLKDSNGRVLATIEADTVADTKTKITKSGVPLTRVAAKSNSSDSEEEEVDTGYVEDSVLQTMTESTVEIPANFAGMESIMVPTRLRDQLFDIIDVNEEDGYVEITAVHMFYRQRQNNTLFDPDLETKYSGASCCRNVLTNAMFDQGFLVASDSTDQIDGDRLDFARKNIVEAFLDPESGICARYGLSLIRDNDVFYCLKNVGYDRGFIVQDKKNMLGVQRKESIENLVTRVAPVGRDEDGELVWLNNNGLKYVDSTHINDYVSPKLEIYQTDLRIGEDGVTASNIQAKLLEAAQKRFTEDQADLPEVTMTIQFISLGDTEEYQQYRDLDKVYLYDIIHIKDTERGYNYAAQVIGVQHNILTGMLESVTIGTPEKWDGVRNIGSWQIPEFNGGKIRRGSIRAKSFEEGAVQEDDIADQAVAAKHFSTSANTSIANNARAVVVAEATEQDGIIHTKWVDQDDKIGMVIEVDGQGNNVIRAAEITLAINASTGQTEAIINANKIRIGNPQTSTTTLNDLVTVESVSSANAFKVTANSLFDGAVTVRGPNGTDGTVSTKEYYVYAGGKIVFNGAAYGQSWDLDAAALLALIKDVQIVQVAGTNDYQLQAKSFSADSWVNKGSTFSRAITSWTEGWSNGRFTVTANPQNQSAWTELVQGTATWNGTTVTIPINAYDSDNPSYTYSTGKSVTATYSGTPAGSATIDDIDDKYTSQAVPSDYHWAGRVTLSSAYAHCYLLLELSTGDKYYIDIDY